MSDVFISYASEDRSRIGPLAAALERRGWDVFWDLTIPPGKTFDSVIEAELEAARCVVVVWTANSVKSQWVLAEAAEARDREVLLPVLMDRIPLPLGFRRVQAADLTAWEPTHPNAGFDSLVAAIAELAGRAAPGDRAPSWIAESYHQGVRAFERGNWRQAVSLLESVVEHDPTFRDAAALLSQARSRRFRTTPRLSRRSPPLRYATIGGSVMVLLVALAITAWPQVAPGEDATPPPSSRDESTVTAVITTSPEPPTPAFPADDIAAPDTTLSRPIRVSARIPVKSHPIGLTFEQGYVWVALRDILDLGATDQLVRIDPALNDVVDEPIRMPTRPYALVSGGGYLWASQANDHEPSAVSRLDLAVGPDSPLVEALPSPRWPQAIAFANGKLWVASRSEGTIVGFDPVTWAQDGDPVELGFELIRMAVDTDGTTIWATSHSASKLVEFDAGTRSVRQIDLSSPVVGETAQPIAVAVTDEYVVVTDGELDRIVIIDKDNVLDRRYVENIASWPDVAYSDGERVWVLARDSGQIYEIDPESATASAPQTIGTGLVWMTGGAGSLWVSDRGDLFDADDDFVIRLDVDGLED